MIKKNTAQRWWVYCIDGDTGRIATGQAASITATICKDSDSFVATNDVNPTEVETSGYYFFELTANETNATSVDIIPVHSSAKYVVVPLHGERWTIDASWSSSNSAQLAGIFNKVNGAPIVLSSTATNVFSGNPITIYRGSEHSSTTPLGPLTFNVSNSYNVAGWTGTLKIFQKYGSATSATISVAGDWADTGLSTQRLEFTLQETDTDNLDLETEYEYQVELLCTAGHPYASPKGGVVIGSVHS